MRAIRIHELGDPETLRYEEAPDPEPRTGQVLIRVRAIGVNFADTMFTRGMYFLRPKVPQVPGADVAGEVASLGEGVSGFAVSETRRLRI